MSDEVFLGGKNYISSKRAAETSGYARDYIGQLSRAGIIDAQRVGGLWYVSMKSLEAYKRNAEMFTPSIQVQKAPTELDTVVNFDGKEYISASKAARITAYNQDYIGQLARGGKILSRQIGNRWYVERSGLLTHKTEKDRLLASVQAESLGLYIPKAAQNETLQDAAPMLTYIREENPLMPVLNKRTEEVSVPVPSHAIPIRVMRPSQARVAPSRVSRKVGNRVHGNTMIRAAEAGVALTFVIVLSYGFISLKANSLYTFNLTSGSKVLQSNAFTASAASSISALGDMIENWLAPRAVYVRPQ